jgi:hypothetical protein
MLEQIQERVPTTKRIKTYILICQETQSLTPRLSDLIHLDFYLRRHLKPFKCIQNELKMMTLHQRIFGAC